MINNKHIPIRFNGFYLHLEQNLEYHNIIL